MSPAQEAATIATWGSSMPDPTGKNRRGHTPQEVAFLSKLVASEDRLSKMPDMPVTIVNLNPYNLMVLHPLFDGLVVKANKDGERYSALVIRKVKYEVDQGLDRNHSPVERWPIEMAGEFTSQYADKGGVFHFFGDLEKNPELALTAAFKEAYAIAETRLIAYCRTLKARADASWNSPNHSGAKDIHPAHRQAAKILFTRKLLKELPAWMTGDVDIADVTPDCPSCRTTTKKHQVVCGCGFILDPFNGFKLGAIDEYHQALERLTRKQLKDLGVSGFVAENFEERPERLEAGLPKPRSKFEIQQQAALDAEKKKA
jgi:hypothetical protein